MNIQEMLLEAGNHLYVMDNRDYIQIYWTKKKYLNFLWKICKISRILIFNKRLYILL